MTEREEAIAGIRRGLEEMAAGRGQPLDVAFADLRREVGIPNDVENAALRGNGEHGEIKPPRLRDSHHENGPFS